MRTNHTIKTTTLAIAAAMTAGTLAHAQEAVQWRVEDGGNGHWYECIRVLEGVNWHDANSACEARGGHLATIHSSAENQIVFSLIGPGSTWPMRFGPWLGGLETPSGWAWVTGEAWTWTNWMPGEPNNVCPLGEDRLHYIEYGDQWNDLYHTGYCGTEGPTWGYMAEWSADCNGDGIVDYGQCRDGSLPDYNGNNIPDCCEQGVPCEVGSYPVQWRVEDGGNGHWYGNIGQGGCWSERRTQAAAIGGHLATVSDAEELSLIESLVPRSFYLGGYRIVPVPEGDPQDGWRWITDEPVPMQLRCITNFPISEQWLSGTAGLGCVGESDECSPYHYLIEWSADCNGDGIVDYGQILDGTFADTNANGVPDPCECDADINDDGTVNGADISVLLGYWGQSGKNVVGDITGDGIVNGADLAQLLGSWGPCQ